jgi:hypothetical protein
MSPPALIERVRSELLEPVDPRAVAMAEAIARQYGAAARAVLFYGSCLRESALDALMLDFYLIVSDYREAYGPGWLAFANRVLPPNVFPFRHEGLVAKYAVLSEADFHLGCGPLARDVSTWARFAQPTRIVWASSDAARDTAVASISRAAPTLLAYAQPMAGRADAIEVWKRGFELTYSCELRAERDDRPAKIVLREPDRYRAFFDAAEAEGLPPLPVTAPRAWKRFRRRGKWLSVARLTKALTTFTGGIDYLAWKINRHAGTQIEVKPWQRRWPLIGAIALLPRLLRQGAIR